MNTYSHLPCPLLSIVVGVGRSTVGPQIQSADWDITVDVMHGNYLIEKNHKNAQRKIKMGRNQVFTFPLQILLSIAHCKPKTPLHFPYTRVRTECKVGIQEI